MPAIVTALAYLAVTLLVWAAVERHGARIERIAGALREAVDRLAKQPPDTLPDIERRLVSLESLAATLPSTWEDWYAKIDRAAAREERAAQRLEKRRRERAELEDDDDEPSAAPWDGAPGVDAPPAGDVRPMPAEMDYSSPMARSAALREAWYRLKFGDL